jgi:hypothetical protein
LVNVVPSVFSVGSVQVNVTELEVVPPELELELVLPELELELELELVLPELELDVVPLELLDVVPLELEVLLPELEVLLPELELVLPELELVLDVVPLELEVLLLELELEVPLSSAVALVVVPGSTVVSTPSQPLSTNPAPSPTARIIERTANIVVIYHHLFTKVTAHLH